MKGTPEEHLEAAYGEAATKFDTMIQLAVSCAKDIRALEPDAHTGVVIVTPLTGATNAVTAQGDMSIDELTDLLIALRLNQLRHDKERPMPERIVMGILVALKTSNSSIEKLIVGGSK